MQKTLAFTGSTGKKSGGAFLRELVENSERINVLFPDGIKTLIRSEHSAEEIKSLIPNIQLHIGSLSDEALLVDFLRDVDTLVHIAGINFSLKIVKAAIECNVRRLIFVHTTGIYSKYKAAGESYRKTEAEVYELCKKHNIILTICRPTMIYGNLYDNNIIKFIKMVDRLPVMPVVNGARYPLQPVHYNDLAKAYYHILINEEKTANKDYILSGAAPIELREMFKTMGALLNKKVRFINCPFVIAYAGSWILYLCTFTKMDYREKVQRLCEPRAYSHAEATKDFGYSPRPFEEGVEGEIEQYLTQKS